MPEAIGQLQLVGSHFAASYWGIAISRVAFCPQAIGGLQFQGSDLQGLALRQAISYQRVPIGGLLAASVFWGITICSGISGSSCS